MKKPTLYHESKLNELDETVSAKLLSLSRKYPEMCAQYLIEMHEVLDWAEIELKKMK